MKAFATNSRGQTFYGEEIEVWIYALMDIDGNGYHTITIGDQTWTVENYKCTRFKNGDLIPNVTENIYWSDPFFSGEGLTTPAMCWYNNDRSRYDTKYGALYNWYSASDLRGLAPYGWHVSTDEEWTILKDFLGENPGGKIKSLTNDWKEPNLGATNSSGFTALPGGDRGDSYDGRRGTFFDMKTDAAFWSSTNFWGLGWVKYVSYDKTDLFINQAFHKSYGNSIRLVKD